jgi:hypothetical protein
MFTPHESILHATKASQVPCNANTYLLILLFSPYVFSHILPLKGRPIRLGSRRDYLTTFHTCVLLFHAPEGRRIAMRLSPLWKRAWRCDGIGNSWRPPQTQHLLVWALGPDSRREVGATPLATPGISPRPKTLWFRLWAPILRGRICIQTQWYFQKIYSFTIVWWKSWF